MADKSTISWTDATWTIVTGCSRVSAGCARCYAETLSLRRGWTAKPWTAANAAENVVCHADRLDWPLKWRAPRKVFVTSMGDLFHERVPDEFIDQVFATMAHCSGRHTFQVLTKRPERMAAYLTAPDVRERVRHEANWQPTVWTWPLRNVWVGTSVEAQREADLRIPYLLRTPAAVRFLSCEPLLGLVDLRDEWLLPETGGVNWVIVGGESGPGYRPMDLAWARSLRDQCAAAGVAYWFKQGSGPRPGMHATLDGREYHEWPVILPEALRQAVLL